VETRTSMQYTISKTNLRYSLPHYLWY